MRRKKTFPTISNFMTILPFITGIKFIVKKRIYVWKFPLKPGLQQEFLANWLNSYFHPKSLERFTNVCLFEVKMGKRAFTVDFSNIK